MPRMPLKELFASTSRHAGKLAAIEVELFKSEIGGIKSRMAEAAIYGLTAFSFLLIGLGFFLAALTLYLISRGFLPWQACVIVASIACVAAALFAVFAKVKLGPHPMLPVRTMAQLKEDIAVLCGSIRDV